MKADHVVPSMLQRKHLHNSHSVKIRDIARIIGYLISSFPGVKFAALYYRYVEMDKIKALKQSKGNFDALMSVSKKELLL